MYVVNFALANFCYVCFCWCTEAVQTHKATWTIMDFCSSMFLTLLPSVVTVTVALTDAC